MPIFYRYNSNHIMITGQTYPYKESIKKLGARFIGDRKSWQLPFNSDNLALVERLCKDSGGGALDQANMEPSLARQINDNKFLQIKKPLSPPTAASKDTTQEPQSYSIKELMQLANSAISQRFPSQIWIIGEVQNIQLKQRAIYLSLAEKLPDSQSMPITVNATIWHNQLQAIFSKHGRAKTKEILRDGVEVKVYCQVSLYQGRGSLSLNITQIDPSYTQGQLALAREALLRELKQKGLHLANKQKQLPPIPLKVGLLSAESSRAANDFIHHLEQGSFPGSLYFLPIATQGEGVMDAVENGISQLSQLGCDLIVLTRGGGSAADLKSFDSSKVAYAIAHSPRPIIAAIGHHDDVSVSEEVSHTHAKTPTAAADFILDIFATTRNRLEVLQSRMASQLDLSLRMQEQQLRTIFEQFDKQLTSNLSKSLQHQVKLLHHLERTASQKLNQYEQKINSAYAEITWKVDKQLGSLEQNLNQVITQRLFKFSEQLLHSYTLQLESLNRTLVKLDPSPWIKQGWSRLFGAKGTIKSIKDVEVNEQLTAVLQDGHLQLSVASKIRKTNQQIKSTQETSH